MAECSPSTVTLFNLSVHKCVSIGTSTGYRHYCTSCPGISAGGGCWCGREGLAGFDLLPLPSILTVTLPLLSPRWGGERSTSVTQTWTARVFAWWGVVSCGEGLKPKGWPKALNQKLMDNAFSCSFCQQATRGKKAVAVCLQGVSNQRLKLLN